MNDNEKLLNALINDEDVSNIEPKSRNEQILKNCCERIEYELKPKSRMEELLKELAHKRATEIPEVLGGEY